MWYGISATRLATGFAHHHLHCPWMSLERFDKYILSIQPKKFEESEENLCAVKVKHICGFNRTNGTWQIMPKKDHGLMIWNGTLTKTSCMMAESEKTTKEAAVLLIFKRMHGKKTWRTNQYWQQRLSIVRVRTKTWTNRLNFQAILTWTGIFHNRQNALLIDRAIWKETLEPIPHSGACQNSQWKSIIVPCSGGIPPIAVKYSVSKPQ